MFCKQCGFEINDISLKKCPKCNTAVGKGGRFCSDCGKKLNSGEKCECTNNIKSEKREPGDTSVRNEKTEGPIVGAVTKQSLYIEKEEPAEKPVGVNKRIAGNPLLEKIARGENSDKSKEIIRNEAVKIVYGKDMTVEKLREQQASEIKANEEKRLAEQKRIEEVKRLENERRVEEKRKAEEAKRLAEQKKQAEAQKNVTPVPPYPFPSQTVQQPVKVPIKQNDVAEYKQTQPVIEQFNNPSVDKNMPSPNNGQVIVNGEPVPNNNSPINKVSVSVNAESCSNDSKQLFPEAFSSQNMSYQPPIPDARQHGPTSRPVSNQIKKEKNFDGLWVTGLICVIASLKINAFILSLALIVLAIVFGAADIAFNKQKTGIGVVIGGLIMIIASIIGIII